MVKQMLGKWKVPEAAYFEKWCTQPTESRICEQPECITEFCSFLERMCRIHLPTGGASTSLDELIWFLAHVCVKPQHEEIVKPGLSVIMLLFDSPRDDTVPPKSVLNLQPPAQLLGSIYCEALCGGNREVADWQTWSPRAFICTSNNATMNLPLMETYIETKHIAKVVKWSSEHFLREDYHFGQNICYLQRMLQQVQQTETGAEKCRKMLTELQNIAISTDDMNTKITFAFLAHSHFSPTEELKRHIRELLQKKSNLSESDAGILSMLNMHWL